MNKNILFVVFFRLDSDGHTWVLEFSGQGRISLAFGNSKSGSHLPSIAL